MKLELVCGLVMLVGCGPDQFVSIGPPEDAGSDLGIEGGSDVEDAARVETSIDAPGDAGVPVDADADAPSPPVCDPGDLLFGGKCFYLDGTGGVCAQGYAVSSDGALAAIVGNNPNAWQGRNYRSKVSVNCCVWTTDSPRNFGMVSHCNVPGPFGAGEPKYGGNSCTSQIGIVKTDQITLCERPL